MSSEISKFLFEKNLQLLIHKDEVEDFKQSVLDFANCSYVLQYTEQPWMDNMVLFSIHCPKTNFAMAFWHLGQCHARWHTKKRQEREGKNAGDQVPGPADQANNSDTEKNDL